jgi:hypothetical protein
MRQMPYLRLHIGLFLMATSVSALAGAVSGAITISATVIEVQCTAEQQAKFRACAKPVQQTSVGPYKTMVTTESQTGQSDAFAPRREIFVDPSRQVIIKTLLY